MQLTDGHQFLEQFNTLGRKGMYSEVKALTSEKKLTVFTAEVRESWASAVFSDTGNAALERFFSYQVSYLSGLLACCCPEQPGLCYKRSVCELIDFAGDYFGKYLDWSVPVDRVYKKHFTTGLSGEAGMISAALENADPDPSLKNCLITYLEDMTGDTSAPSTIGQLYYFRLFVRELLPLVNLEDGTKACAFLKDRLVDLEFNHFGVFVYLQDAIRDSWSGKPLGKRKALISRELDVLTFKEKGEVSRYDERWPPLTTMIAEWLKGEQKSLVKEPAVTQIMPAGHPLKLKLQLPVSHLAFLIQLFSKENVFGLVPLTNIFGFFTANFSTKRQETLSVGGLSKEYYTKNMVTAVEVRALLSKMIARINRDYFPAWVAVCITIFFP